MRYENSCYHSNKSGCSSCSEHEYFVSLEEKNWLLALCSYRRVTFLFWTMSWKWLTLYIETRSVVHYYFSSRNQSPPAAWGDIFQTFRKMVLDTLAGNFKAKNQYPWKFHMIFSWSPLETPQLFWLTPDEIPINQPPLFGFFGNSPIAHPSEKRKYFFPHLVHIYHVKQ